MTDRQLLEAILHRLDRLERSLGAGSGDGQPPPPPDSDHPRALVLGDELIESFLAWSHDQGNSAKWIRDQRRYLAWWRDCFAGKDLRTLDLASDIVSALDEAPGARHLRIAVLKRLFSWLRTVRHLIEPHQDPTLHRLKVPQARPAQAVANKAFSAEAYRVLRVHVPAGRWRDALDLLAGTGWHVSELLRFAESGAVERRAIHGAAGILVCPKSKAGAPKRTAVTAEVLEAAARLRSGGRFSERWFRAVIARAAKQAGVEITPGRFRHAIATHAVDEGASLEAVASYLDHRSARTTRRFYATHATPAKVPTLA